MGLFDYLAEKASDASEYLSDKVSESLDNIVDNAMESINDKITEVTGDIFDKVGETVSDVSDSILSKNETYRKFKNRANDFNSKVLSNFDSQLENEDLSLPFLGKNTSKNTQQTLSNNLRQPQIIIKTLQEDKKTKDVSIVSISKQIEQKLDKLDQQLEKAIKEIDKNGNNLLASFSDTFLKKEKFKKINEISKKIVGKTKEEKINDIKDEFDLKKSKIIQKIIPDSDPKLLWELINFIHSLSFKELGIKSKIACQKLFEELMMKSEIILSVDKEYSDKYKHFKDYINK